MARPKNDGKGRLGGRAKSTPNKVTGEAKSALAAVVEAYVSGEGLGQTKAKVSEDLEAMQPAERAKVMKDLIPYVIPKLSAVELKDKVPVKTYKEELEEMREETP